MSRPPATPEQREDRRRQIRRAAYELFSEGGHAAVTARSVAERAGVSPGHIYNYFDSLSDLMRSLWSQPAAAFGRQLVAAAEAEPDPLARIHTLLETLATYLDANPDMLRGAYLFVRNATMPAADVQPLEDVTFHRLLRDAVAEGQATGVIREGDPDHLAQLLWSGLHGAVGLPVNVDRFALAPAADITPQMIELLMAWVEAPVG
ncbi:MAG: TetR/AcrR family transcriptional regulator, partial [Actinomycetota bacterium]